MRFRRKTLKRIAGASWLLTGVGLLFMGRARLMQTVHDLSQGSVEGHPLANWLSNVTGSTFVALGLLVMLAVVLGYAKSRFALQKTMQRLLNRVEELAEPARFSQLYGWGYLVLLLAMMGLGIACRVLGVPEEIRAVILFAVGFALLRTSLMAFRQPTDDKESRGVVQ